MDRQITVRNTEDGTEHKFVVLSMSPRSIRIVVGEGKHSMICTLTPNRMNTAFAGSIAGRELVYERSPDAVKRELEQLNPRVKQRVR